MNPQPLVATADVRTEAREVADEPPEAKADAIARAEACWADPPAEIAVARALAAAETPSWPRLAAFAYALAMSRMTGEESCVGLPAAVTQMLSHCFKLVCKC